MPAVPTPLLAMLCPERKAWLTAKGVGGWRFEHRSPVTGHQPLTGLAKRTKCVRVVLLKMGTTDGDEEKMSTDRERVGGPAWGPGSLARPWVPGSLVTPLTNRTQEGTAPPNGAVIPFRAPPFPFQCQTRKSPGLFPIVSPAQNPRSRHQAHHHHGPRLEHV